MRRSLIAFGISALFVLIWPATALAAILVPLGTAGNYAVLAGTAITGDPPSSWISGQMGISPNPLSSVTGFPPSTSGHIDAANAAAVQAKSDLTTAYLNAAGQTPCTPAGPELGGLTLVAGIYCGGTMLLTGTLTLSGGGVYIFQINSTLITGDATGARVSLINGAQPCDIFWQVGSSATIGAATAFVGNIMALDSIAMNARATLNGRALARNGAVTLINNRIIQAAGCGFSAPAFVAAPAGNTLPATLAPSSPILPGPTGIPDEMRGEFPFLLLLALGAGIGATALGLSSRRRRRRSA
jgi:Ice-binding-like